MEYTDFPRPFEITGIQDLKSKMLDPRYLDLVLYPESLIADLMIPDPGSQIVVILISGVFLFPDRGGGEVFRLHRPGPARQKCFNNVKQCCKNVLTMFLNVLTMLNNML